MEGEGGAAKLTMGTRNFNLRGSQPRTTGKIVLKQSLIYIQPFHPTHANFLLVPLQFSGQKKTMFGEKNIAPPSSYAYDKRYQRQKYSSLLGYDAVLLELSPPT